MSKPTTQKELKQAGQKSRERTAARARKTLAEVLRPEEVKEVQPLIKLEAYRMLTKLAVDHVPLMKLNSYCAMVLEQHANASGKDAKERTK